MSPQKSFEGFETCVFVKLLTIGSISNNIFPPTLEINDLSINFHVVDKIKEILGEQ